MMPVEFPSAQTDEVFILSEIDDRESTDFIQAVRTMPDKQLLADERWQNLWNFRITTSEGKPIHIEKIHPFLACLPYLKPDASEANIEMLFTVCTNLESLNPIKASIRPQQPSRRPQEALPISAIKEAALARGNAAMHANRELSTTTDATTNTFLQKLILKICTYSKTNRAAILEIFDPHVTLEANGRSVQLGELREKLANPEHSVGVAKFSYPDQRSEDPTFSELLQFLDSHLIDPTKDLPAQEREQINARIHSASIQGTAHTWEGFVKQFTTFPNKHLTSFEKKIGIPNVFDRADEAIQTLTAADQHNLAAFKAALQKQLKQRKQVATPEQLEHAARFFPSGNQDAVATKVFADGSVLLSVADGISIGGGPEASRIAVEKTQQASPKNEQPQDALAFLSRAVADAHLAVIQESSGEKTTLLCIWIAPNGDRYIANVADSHVWEIRDGQLVQDLDMITDTGFEGRLTQAIGQAKEEPFTVHTSYLSSPPPESLLATTDGFGKIMGNETYRQRVQDAYKRRQSVEAIIQEVQAILTEDPQAAGGDDVTIAGYDFPRRPQQKETDASYRPLGLLRELFSWNKGTKLPMSRE